MKKKGKINIEKINLNEPMYHFHVILRNKLYSIVLDSYRVYYSAKRASKGSSIESSLNDAV